MTSLAPLVWAEALAIELNRRGFNAVRLSTADHDKFPCIRVVGAEEQYRATPSYIYVAPDDEGVIWFWSEDLEPIAPVIYVGVAVDIIDAQMKLQRLRMPRVYVM